MNCVVAVCAEMPRGILLDKTPRRMIYQYGGFRIKFAAPGAPGRPGPGG